MASERQDPTGREPRAIEPRGSGGAGGGVGRWLVVLLLLLVVGVGLLHQLKPMPPGTHVFGSVHDLDPSDVELLFDLTYRADGEQVLEQRLFDRLFELIDRAESFLILDLFLFNEFAGDASSAHRPLTSELTNRLLERRRARPDLEVLLVTDPLNKVYGSERVPHLERLEAGGVDVVYTDLGRLRDSNPVYSSFWRVFLQWFGNEVDGSSMANPFDPGDRTTLRSYLELLNFKANHRKLAVVGRTDEPPLALVMSANPHDASSRHSNVGILVRGAPAIELARSELEVAAFSGWADERGLGARLEAAASAIEARPGPTGKGLVGVEALTEGGVRDRLISEIEAAGPGDRIDGAMFYLSHRGVVEALIDAARRGVAIRLVLDANRDAFGREKRGIPNRPVAHELRSETDGAIEIRWYETHGEQFHTKMVVVRREGKVSISAGSSNLTRRNIDDYNLEANLRVVAPVGSELEGRVGAYFERIWSNEEGDLYTVDYAAYEEASPPRYLLYRVMEATGLSTF